MNVIARDLIFRKVPLHEDATDNVEIPQQSKAQITAILDDLKMSLKDYEFPEVFCFKSKKDARITSNNTFPIMIVRFPFDTQVRILYEQLKKELNNSPKFSNISVDRSLPPSLRQSFSLANSFAFEFFKKKNFRTRVDVES